MTTDRKAPREFSADAREAMAGEGVAMPDGSYPIPDRGALKRAIQSFGRATDPAAVKRHIVKRARALGAEAMLPEGWASSKAFAEMKAEPMEAPQLDRWLEGKVPRRVLVVPFGGPLPGGKAGLDLDGEYFDDETDLYGPYPALRRSRERLVDWHHDNDPTGLMKGAVLGRVVLDDKPEDAGVWADFWANAGEQRRRLVADLERRGAALYGSSQAVAGSVRKAADGHIEMWPLVRHTITTSPQNTYAVVPPLKALLAADYPSDALTAAAIMAAAAGPGAPPSSGPRSRRGGASSRGGGDGPGKARRAEQEAELAELARALIARRRARLGL